MSGKITGQARANLIYTIAPLGLNAHYAPAAFIVESVKTLLITASSDVAGSYIVSFSNNPTTGFVPMPSVAVAAGVPNFAEIRAYGNYMKIDYTNGAVNQLSFVLDVDGFAI